MENQTGPIEHVFQGNTRNYYHTIKESNIKKIAQNTLSGNAVITGFSKESIRVGDVLNISNQKYLVIAPVFRNHAGIFNNPADKINSFFTVQTIFQKFISVK